MNRITKALFAAVVMMASSGNAVMAQYVDRKNDAVKQNVPLDAFKSEQRKLMNFGWKFAMGNPNGAERADYDDSAWRVLDVPHDYLNWTVSERQMAVTNNAFFMHCLPVRRNMIVTDDVIEAPTSIVIPEAANREISATVVLKRMLESL